MTRNKNAGTIENKHTVCYLKKKIALNALNAVSRFTISFLAK